MYWLKFIHRIPCQQPNQGPRGLAYVSKICEPWWITAIHNIEIDVARLPATTCWLRWMWSWMFSDKQLCALHRLKWIYLSSRITSLVSLHKPCPSFALPSAAMALIWISRHNTVPVMFVFYWALAMWCVQLLEYCDSWDLLEGLDLPCQTSAYLEEIICKMGS